jgi:hypothetical protein
MRNADSQFELVYSFEEYVALCLSQRAPGRKEQKKTCDFRCHFSRLPCFIIGDSFSRKTQKRTFIVKEKRVHSAKSTTSKEKRVKVKA